MNMRQWIWFSVRCAISALLIYLLVNAVDLGLARTYLARICLAPFVIATAAFLIATFINTVRWYVLLVIQEHKVSLWKLFSYNLANAWYVMVLPGGKVSAEAVRLYQVMKDSYNPRAAVHAAAAAFIDRAVGFGVFVAIVVLFFTVYAPTLASVSREFLIAAGGVVAFLALSAIIVTPARIVRLLRLWLPFTEHFSMTELIKVYRSRPALMILILILSVVSTAIVAFGLYSIAQALSLAVSYEVALAALSIGMISSLVPITIAGIGLREGALAGSLVFLAGIPTEAAVVISFAMLFSSLGVALLGGLVEFHRHFLRKKT